MEKEGDGKEETEEDGKEDTNNKRKYGKEEKED